MSDSEAETRALRLALTRGYLTQRQVEAARSSASAGQVLPSVAHLLTPSQLQELRQAYAGLDPRTRAAPDPAATFAPGTPGAAADTTLAPGSAGATPDLTLTPGTPGAAPALGSSARGAPAPRAPSLPQPGEVVAGAYQVLRLLGRGGMGAVYLARDPLQREVALKVQLRSRGGERFRTEGQAVARLSHPGIVPIHQLGVDEVGRHYCVMGYVPGGSLEDRLEPEGTLPPREAARIARDVARALAYAHQEGVLHRDIKPANLLVTPAGEVVITDFGLAKIVDQSQQLSKTGDFLGTPAFMSPEQARGDVRRIGPAADIYSVGATLYSLLTGRPPFYDMPPIQLLMSVVNLPAQPPSSLRPELDPALDAICLRCLEKGPEDRYADMEALAADLSAYLQVGAAGVAALSRARSRRWRRRGLGALLALAFLTPGAAALLALTPSEEPAPPAPAPSSLPPVASAPRGPRPLVSDQALELRPGERAEFSPDPADGALVVELRGPPGALLQLSTPSRRARVRCEAGWALPLTLSRERARFPLEQGPHGLELDPEASGPVVLRLRRLSEPPPLQRSRDNGLGVLPPLAEAFRTPAAREAAERALAALRAETNLVRQWERPRLIKEALAELRRLSASAGTPLAELLIEALTRHLPADPIAPTRPAERAALRLLPEVPDHFSVQWYCALAESRAGRLPQAIAHWRRCLEFEPRDPDTRCNLLAELLRARDYEPLQREGEQLLALRPRSTEALGFLLLAKLWLGSATPAEAARCAHMSHQIYRSRRVLPFLQSLYALLEGGSLGPREEPSLSREQALAFAEAYLGNTKRMFRRLSRLSNKDPHRWDKLIQVRSTLLVEGEPAAQALLERYTLDLANSPKVAEPYARLKARLR